MIKEFKKITCMSDAVMFAKTHSEKEALAEALRLNRVNQCYKDKEAGLASVYLYCAIEAQRALEKVQKIA